MKILLFGKNGQLGWELQRSLAPLGELVALGSHGEALPSDFCEPDRLAETVRQVRPDVIVNAAAYTAVDKAESEQDKARLINAVAPGVLARAAEALGALLVHYSTDYVFNGSGSIPWRESDSTQPLNAYGESKLEGERSVAVNCDAHLIFRTSWLYAARGENFAKNILRLAQERDQLNIVTDQVGAPTGADFVADVTAHCIRSTLKDPACAGTYHLAAGGETSWHGYATHLIETARNSGLPIKVQADAVRAAQSAAFPTVARRPANSRLDCGRLKSIFGLHQPDWQSGVERLLQELHL